VNPQKNQEGSFLGRFHFYIAPVPKQIRPFHLPGIFRELDEVCSEVPVYSQVLRVHRL